MTTRLAQLEIEEKIDFTRQRDFFDPTKSDARVTVVGCGGIGSVTAVLLSKLGIPNLTLIDGDNVETHNLPNQFFPNTMVDKPKVDVCRAMCTLFGSSEVAAHNCMVEDYPEKLNGIIVTGLDSMKARQTTWDLIKANPLSVQYLVDARIGGQEIVIWTVDPKIQKDVEDYETQAMFTDAEGEEAPCTARAVIDVMGFVAALVVNQVRRIATREVPPKLLTLSVSSLNLLNWYKDEKEQTTSHSTAGTTQVLAGLNQS